LIVKTRSAWQNSGQARSLKGMNFVLDQFLV